MASTYSLSLSSFPLSKPNSLSPSLPSLSFSRSSPPSLSAAAVLSLSLAFSASRRFDAVVSSRFVRNVAVSSELEQDEDDEGALDGESDGNVGAAEETQFSPDLQLFVGNLPFSVDSAQLAGLFESAGTVEMVEVIYDKMTGRSRGFGFVTMSSIEEVEAAEQQFNNYVLEGRTLRVNAGPAPPKREDSGPRTPRGGSSFESSNRLYVGNLSWGVDDLALKSLFSDHGDVVEAKVIYDRESGRARGFGFVTYNSVEEVNRAIENLDGADLEGRPIRVTVAEARPPRRQF